ncbi:MAG: DegT/DnrJ/EryC1/StrS family aminotransferase [Candidatus Omnitrophica bacterium]|nr:DegT/DnrJ/EryC1/StrS family aminotransferase [Candidatus Omnitrophota bacterium]
MDYQIPLFDLNFDDEEEKAVVETLRSKWISLGPKTEELEKEFSNMLSCKHSLGVANCTVALHLGLLLLGVKEGDEVITPSLTFVATVNSIRYVGATPVFCDIKGLDDLTIDPDMIETLITPKTKAIIVMHYGGFPCDMDRIMRIAQKHNLRVLEDACHGPLSEYKGQKLGTIGDIGAFSFFSNKNISTGEGGILVTNTPEYFERGKLLRSHGMTSLSHERSKGHATNYDVVELGFNYRIDDIHSAIALVQIKKLRDDIKGRINVRKRYLANLSSNEKIIIPFKNNLEFASNYIFPIILKDSTVQKRDAVRNQLHEAGIQTSVHYPAVHRFSIYKEYNAQLKNTEYVTDNEITLPMYSKLTHEKIYYIANVINKIL